MDEDIKLFLKRIAESIITTILWMIPNIFFGLYKGYAFFTNKIAWQNIVYYLLFIVTGIMLFFHIRKK